MAITAVVHRKLAFRDRRGDETLSPSALPQLVSQRVAKHPYFLAAMASGWVTNLQSWDDEGNTIAPAEKLTERPTKSKR